jgi:hypothetical protein
VGVWALGTGLIRQSLMAENFSKKIIFLVHILY